MKKLPIYLFIPASQLLKKGTKRDYVAVDFARGMYFLTSDARVEDTNTLRIPLKTKKNLQQVVDGLRQAGFLNANFDTFFSTTVYRKINDAFILTFLLKHSNGKDTVLLYRPLDGTYAVKEHTHYTPNQKDFLMELSTVAHMEELILQVADLATNIHSQSSYEVKPATNAQFDAFMLMMKGFGHDPDMEYGDELYIAPTLGTAARYYNVDVREFKTPKEVYTHLLHVGNIYPVEEEKHKFIYVLPVL